MTFSSKRSRPIFCPCLLFPQPGARSLWRPESGPSCIFVCSPRHKKKAAPVYRGGLIQSFQPAMRGSAARPQPRLPAAQAAAGTVLHRRRLQSFRPLMRCCRWRNNRPPKHFFPHLRCWWNPAGRRDWQNRPFRCRIPPGGPRLPNWQGRTTVHHRRRQGSHTRKFQEVWSFHGNILFSP